MASPYSFFIGLRYMRAKKQGFLSIISFISIAGIALGVAALIVVISVMNGFDNDIRDRIIGTNAHVVAASYFKEGIPEYNTVIKEIEKIPHVAAVTPYYVDQVMVKYKDKILGVSLWGIVPDSISKVNNLKKNMIKGDLNFILKDLTAGERGIIVGKELFDNIGAELNDEIIVVSPIFKQTPAGLIPKMSKMKIVGVFESGMYDYDSGFAYVALDTAQTLFDKGDVISGAAIKADKLENANYIATEIHRKFKTIWARDWMAMNKNLFKALQVEKIAMFIILALVVLVAAFNIASTLIMVVMRKTKDIGILKSMGANNDNIRNIFIVQGLFTGIIGTLIGMGIGIGICLILKQYPIGIPGGGSVYYIDKLPVAMVMKDLIFIPVASIVLSFISAIYPAMQAAKLDPVESIRYE